MSCGIIKMEYSEKLGRVDCSHEVKLRARK